MRTYRKAYIQKKEQACCLLFSDTAMLDGALNLVRTQASCTDIDMARRTVNNRFHALDVGFPCTVRPSVRVGDFDTERNTLAADITFCHQLHLLAIERSNERSKSAAMYNSRKRQKKQVFFLKNIKTFTIIFMIWYSEITRLTEIV